MAWRKSLDIEYVRKYSRDYKRKRRLECLKILGGKCNYPGCGYSRIEYLELDHVNGDGFIERKKSSNQFKIWKNAINSHINKDNKYQLLCATHHREKTNDNKEQGRKRFFLVKAIKK